MQGACRPGQDPPSQTSTHRHDPDRKRCPATEKRVRKGACCAISGRPGANMSAAAPQPSAVGPSAQRQRVRKRTCPGWTWSPSTEKTDGALIACSGHTLHCVYLRAFIQAVPSTLHALPESQVPSILGDQCKCHLLREYVPIPQVRATSPFACVSAGAFPTICPKSLLLWV